MGKGKRIHERLESGTNLAIRGCESAIEFALRIIATTHQGANTAAGIVDRHDRAFEIGHGGILTALRWLIFRFHRMVKIGLTLDFCKLGFERLLRGILHGRIERGVNKETAVVDLVLREKRVQIALHRVHRVILLDLQQTLWMRIYLCKLGLISFRRRYFLQLNHAIQNRIALQRRPLRIFQGRKAVGTSNQTSQQRRFGKI